MTQNNEREALIEDEFNKQYPYDDMDGWDRKLFKSGYQAATQARESEINSLKERVEELQADNNQLREALVMALNCVDEEINPNNYNGEILTNFIHDYGRMIDILQNALSSTPAQSLAMRDIIEKREQYESDLIARYTDPNE